MGRQSARLFFNGKDHKEIYMNKNYHDSLHEGRELLWEKIAGEDTGGYDFQFNVYYMSVNEWGMLFRLKGNVTVDWGDGTVEQYNASDMQYAYHNYPRWTTDIMTVSITGDLQDIAFDENEKLYSVLTPFPRSMKAKKDYTGMFKGCDNLRTVADNMFKYCPNVEILASFLQDCMLLQEIPAGLLKNCRKVKDFSNCFRNLPSRITTIPEGLFDYCYAAENFSYCFYGFYGSSIPNGLFKHTNALTFNSCFYSFHGSYLPDNLFEGCYRAEDFTNCFCDTNWLVTIPEDLFDDCHSAKIMRGCFSAGDRINAIPSTLFDNCMEIYDFTNTFAGSDSISGLAPELWLRDNVLYHEGCFNCGALDNYASIPIEWK